MKLLIVLLFSIFFISCTRNLDDKTGLKLIIPSSSKLQAQQTMMSPMFAAVNIHYSDRPTLTRSFELKDRGITGTTGTTAPSELELFVPSVSQGEKTLIQLLVVYEDQNSGAIELNYGDIVSNITGGENLLDISILPIGISTKQMNFAGRYLTSSSGGPTGVVSMMLHPPNGKPAMEVEKEPINNGWFKFFHPGGGAEISYIIKAQNKVLFDKITDTSSIFSPSNYKLKISMPSHYSKDHETFFKNVVEKDVYFGFFKDSASSLDLSGYSVCYRNTNHTVPGAYTTISPSYSPLLYKPTAGTVSTDVTVSGGVGKSFEELYNLNACNITAGNNLVFHSEKLGEGFEDGAFGSRGVFSMINPMQNHESAFVKSSMVGGSSIDLNWSYLPGVLGNSITGTTIFAKYDSYGGGDDSFDRDEFDCREQAELSGMIAVSDTTSEQYSFTGGAGLPAPSGSTVNTNNYKFKLCPYKQTIKGKVFVREGISVHCIGGCNDPFNYGLGDQDKTITASTPLSSLPEAYGAQVTGYTVNTDSLSLTTANPWGTTAFVAGDEVVLNVVAAGSDGQCGSASTEPVGPGFFVFTRVLSMSPSLTIPRNSKIESITTSELSAAGRTPVDDFCLLSVTKVLEYKNLTLSAELNTNAADITNSTVQNIFLKVSGKLTFSGSPSINVSGKGFLGGAGYEHGEGVTGVASASNSTTTGGQPLVNSNFSGGGASFGDGGVNDNGAFASGLHNDYAMYMGGGGAGDVSQPGQNGGGLIYVAARQVDLQADTTILADGADTVANEGAGAGGNIWFLFDEVTNLTSKTLTVSAVGGYAGTSGAGGGGLIKGRVCNADISLMNFLNNGGGTTGSTQQQGTAGNSFDPNNQENSWACEN